MLMWATEFPVKSGCRTSDILKLTKKWLIGSPHNPWPEGKLIREEIANDIFEQDHNGQKLQIATCCDKDGKWCGVKLQYAETDTYEWTTEIIGHETPEQVFVSIQVHCSILKSGAKPKSAHKPYIVKMLLSEIGGGDDGGLPVSDKPIYLREQIDLDKAQQIVTGMLENHLPIVYASATWDDEPFVNPENLSCWLSGMAHVVVEPSRLFSFDLAQKVDRQNAYGGAVSIYWPNGKGTQMRLLPEQFPSDDELAKAVSTYIHKALVNSRPNPTSTWAFVSNLIATDKFKRLRDSGSQEITRYLEMADAEIKAKTELYEKAEEEASRLRSELARANAANYSSKAGLINPGQEHPFYANEVRTTILKALTLAKNSFAPNGRARHIIDDLLKYNNFDAEQDKIIASIKTILSGNNIGKAQKRKLEVLGLAFEESGPHIKATFFNDPRYMFTISKTPSDHREMRNLASDICRKLFQ